MRANRMDLIRQAAAAHGLPTLVVRREGGQFRAYDRRYAGKVLGTKAEVLEAIGRWGYADPAREFERALARAEGR